MMIRIETEDKRRAAEIWARLDAAGYQATPPLPTTGLGRWSVVVSGATVTRQDVFRALPPYLRQGVIFSELE